MATRQFLNYLAAGGTAALLNWASRFLFSIWLNYSVAIILAFFVGLISGFVLMRWWVFHGARSSASVQMPIYVLVNALALLQTLAVSLVLADYLLPRLGITHPDGPAHLAGVMVPAFTSYFGHKYFTFR